MYRTKAMSDLGQKRQIGLNSNISALTPRADTAADIVLRRFGSQPAVSSRSEAVNKVAGRGRDAHC
jgi:hypothetical protein